MEESVGNRAGKTQHCRQMGESGREWMAVTSGGRNVHHYTLSFVGRKHEASRPEASNVLGPPDSRWLNLKGWSFFWRPFFFGARFFLVGGWCRLELCHFCKL